MNHFRSKPLRHLLGLRVRDVLHAPNAVLALGVVLVDVAQRVGGPGRPDLQDEAGRGGVPVGGLFRSRLAHRAGAECSCQSDLRQWISPS